MRRRRLHTEHALKALAVVALWVLVAWPRTASAQGPVVPEGGGSARLLWPVEGSFLDIQVAGGVGAALDGSLPFPLQSSGRLGVGYATEPWSFALGGTAAIGGGFDLAFGAELEVNHFAGPYLDLGVAVDTEGFAVGHATLGFALFGVQATGRVSGGRPRYALMATLRLPIGLWWFLDGQQRSAVNQVRAANRAPKVRPPAADVGASRARAREARALEQASAADQEGRLLEADAALARAITHADTPANRIRRAELRERAGRYVAARQDLLHVLTEQSARMSEAQRRDVQGRLRRLMQRVGFIRLLLPEARFPHRIDVDGEPSAGLLQGADQVVDPGRHRLRGFRDGVPLWTADVEVVSGQISRVAPPDLVPARPPE